ncbi:MAG TPA: ABC transporter substrate-binding protein [Acetobacteraceae bacterium]|nr:ABC transporter substrate-binding protein [Acetobacteraceae bacterium]
MHRRSLLLGAAAATLARPAIGGTAKTLIFVPQSPLASLDPVWTSAMTTRNVGFMIYDVLFGRDAEMNPKPQMLAGYVVEDDGRRWVMTLREDLWFHDGERVLARDCTASLRRWMQRDPGGATLAARLDALEAPDDRTIVLRLRKRFPALPKLLSKFQTAAVMVPERIATGTDPFKQMTEIVGSGPFRFLKDEYVIGSHAALVPFERYVPRDEPASFTSGGHRVLVDRVEWQMIPDPATAAVAMVTGEVDWLEMPMPDLLSMLRRAPNVVTGRLDQWGFISQLRPNHVTAPTDNVELRRAIMAAIDQRAVMDAIMGGDPDGTIVPMGFLATGKPEVDLAGIDTLTERHRTSEVKAMLEDAGYHGERLVLLHTTDQPFYNSASLVVADALSRVGMTIDDQAMDWGTVLQRRASKQPLDKGGWSLFVSVTPVPEYRDPLLGSLLRGNGKDAWIGWPDIPRIETAYNAWLDSDDAGEQTRLEREIQLAAFEWVPFVPLGRYMPLAAWSKRISDPLKGPAPVFWNVSKA